MATKLYIGVDGVARQVKKMYVGISGAPRKVKKAYVGVNGVAKLTFEAQDMWQRYTLKYTQTLTQVASGTSVVTYQYGDASGFWWNIEPEFDPATGITSYSGGTYTSSKQYTSQGQSVSAVIGFGSFSNVLRVQASKSMMTIGIQNAGILRVISSGSINISQYTAEGPVKGDLVGTVEAPPGTYPDNGAQGDYWYVKV